MSRGVVLFNVGVACVVCLLAAYNGNYPVIIWAANAAYFSLFLWLRLPAGGEA